MFVSNKLKLCFGFLLFCAFAQTISAYKNWNLRSRKFLGYHVFSLSITNKGRLITGQDKEYGLTNKNINVWTIENPSNIGVLYHLSTYNSKHDGMVTALVVSKQDLLISGSSDGTIRVWDMKYNVPSLKTLKTSNKSEPISSVLSLAITGEDKLISGSGDKSIKVWDLDTGMNLKTFTGHTGWVWSLAIDSKQGQLISGSEDGTIKVWNIKTGQVLKTLNQQSGAIVSLAISKEGEVVSASEKAISVWNIETGELLETLSDTRLINTLVINKKDQLIAGSATGCVMVWDK